MTDDYRVGPATSLATVGDLLADGEMDEETRRATAPTSVVEGGSLLSDGASDADIAAVKAALHAHDEKAPDLMETVEVRKARSPVGYPLGTVIYPSTADLTQDPETTITIRISPNTVPTWIIKGALLEPMWLARIRDDVHKVAHFYRKAVGAQMKTPLTEEQTDEQ